MTRDGRMRCVHDLLPRQCGACEWHIDDEIPADGIGRVVPPDRRRVRPPDVRGEPTPAMLARDDAFRRALAREARRRRRAA